MLIKADGTVQLLEKGGLSMRQIERLIGADALDSFMLRDGVHVAMVDDEGYAKNLPVNAEATRICHEGCYPGTTHQIRGDVVILPDSDFEQ
jgi:hypothetical protein